MVDEKGNPTSYNCQINEYQRKMLIKVLEFVINDREHDLFESKGDVEECMYEEVEAFKTMLEDLPETEKASPNILHGLCL